MKNESILKLSILMSTFLIFFGYFVVNQYIILGFIALLIIICSIEIRFIKIKTDDMLWLICVGLIGLSLCYSQDKAETVKYFMVMSIMIIIKIVYSNIEGYKDYIIKLFYISSLIHVMATIAYIIVPNIMIKICSIILPYKSYLDNLQFYNIGSIAGITGQTGMNAFYISIYISIIYSRIICSNKNKLYNIVLLIIGFIALFLTAKRGPLITNIIAILVVTVIFSNINIKNLMPKLIAFTVLLIIGYNVICRIPQAQVMIDKFTIFSESADITNGRSELWNEASDYIKENPIIGIGAYATPSVMGEMTHNIYVQLVLELGIFGLIFFIGAMIISFILTFKNYYKIKSNKIVENTEKVFFSISVYIQLYFIIYGMSGNPLYGITFLAPYFISIAISSTLKNKI
ncbi:O-antigen ligase family protein [Romboutsia timonensis]|uniref:O-antigen ligase family protein n=1 Tax=Romboutsia timonensis TaxID=1776391 RepID=UPI002A7EBFD0|nr:O-antigen ligase family protein [Romboutsia timonensis]MDY3959687.1 O-antigen ligase family protein [Romboutsia timonensis]